MALERTLNGSGKAKQYLAIIYMLATTLFIVIKEVVPARSNDQVRDLANLVTQSCNRLTAVEVEVKDIREALRADRVEKREDLAKINDRLDTIVRELRR